MRICLGVLALLVGFSTLANSSEITVEYLRAYDGDTIFVNLPELRKMDKKMQYEIFWSEVGVRLAGIDTPEIKGKCPNEIALAKRAKLFLDGILSGAHKVTLVNIDKDKYFRLLGEIFADDVPVAQLLLNAKLAVPYDGGTKANVWCRN